MTLIRAGMAHHLSASAWSDILRELNLRRHDMREPDYLHAIYRAKTIAASLRIEETTYVPFSPFENKNGYGGFLPITLVRKKY